MPSDRRQFVRLCAGGTLAALLGCTDRTGPTGTTDSDVDDWQYDPDEQNGRSGGNVSVAMSATDDGMAATEADDSIGLAAGGAADVSTFRRNVREGYLPIPESMAYEGLFHDYYFETGDGGDCSSLFCPTYTPAVTPDPLSGETERFVTVGLDSGLSKSAFDRPALNLVVVLDISGSMRAEFDQYYYDAYGNKQEVEGETNRAKMAVAKDALVAMTEHLRPDDRLGVVLFNQESHLAKPLRRVDDTDMGAIRGHMQEDVRAGGGTNLSAGLSTAEELMGEYAGEAGEDRENRSILLTDAQINMGETNQHELQSDLEANAGQGHHTTVVGIGVDFNAELIDEITAVRGANYYSVRSADEFQRRLDDEFEYMVTPLVYDLSLELDAPGYEIAQVYGSTVAEEATGELMSVRTLFPSPSSDGKAKGGVVLVRLDELEPNGDLTLEASWETRDGAERSTTERISFPAEDGTHYGNDAVRKAVLLARYADLLRNWTIYERDPDAAPDEESIEPPGTAVGRWEQTSEELVVSERYERRLRSFREHLIAESGAIGDESLEREQELLDRILETADRA